MNAEVQLARPSREPTQSRSRASFERMLHAAEMLLIERGNDDFTLSEVSKVGKVSIGSIYCRFDSKDDLIRAVQVRALAKVQQDHERTITRARKEATSLEDLVHQLVEGVAEVLRKHAPIMRPFMLRATSDPVVATLGKTRFMETEQRFEAAVLARRDEIRHPAPERAVHSCFRVLYSAIARYLGFGSSTTAAWEGDWQELKEDLAAMTSAFLLSSGKR